MRSVGTRWCIAAAMCVFVPSAVWANARLAEASSEGGVPRIAYAQRSYELGRVDKHALLLQRIEFENVGDAPLKIRNVRTTCGCAVVESFPSVVEPAGRGSFVVRLHLRGREGSVAETVFLESNDPDEPLTSFQITAQSVSALSIDPYPISFGAVPFGEPAVCLARVEAVQEGGELDIRDVMIRPRGWSIRLERLDAKTSQLVVRAPGDLLPGAIRGSVVFSVSGSEVQYIEIPVVGEVVGPLKVAPTRILLIGHGGGGFRATRVLRLFPVTSGEFRILEVVPPVPGAEAEAIELEDGSWVVVLKNLPTDQTLDGRSVTIRTDVPQMRDVRIPIRVLSVEQDAGESRATEKASELAA